MCYNEGNRPKILDDPIERRFIMNKLNGKYYLFGQEERLYAMWCMFEVNKKFNIDDGVDQYEKDIQIGMDEESDYIKIEVKDIKKFKKFYKNYIYQYKEKNLGPGSICVK